MECLDDYDKNPNFEQSRPIDTYKISKNNIQDGINNMILYLQEKGWLDNVYIREETKEH